MKSFMKVLLLLLGLFFFCQCDQSEKNPVGNEIDPPDGYTLVWHDEFDGNSINPEKWEHEVNGHGGGNQELQYYTARDTNSFVRDGSLILQCLKEEYTGTDGTRAYTSARLRTRNTGDWTYGRFEIRAKLPGGRGTWPAIWMLPTVWNQGDGGWPDNGEIDIMEHVGYDPGIVHATVHTHTYNHVMGTQKGGAMPVPNALTLFHNYALDWSPEKMDFYVDDMLYFTFQNEGTGWQVWPFDKAFHFVFNIAVGGSWGGAQGVDDSIFPQQMAIDFVRVFQKI